VLRRFRNGEWEDERTGISLVVVSMTTVLLTGGAGFAGSHIADEIVATTDWNVVVLDALT